MRPHPDTRQSSSLHTRVVRFEDVAEVLRLIRGAVEHGCRGHYDVRQRNAVYASYAATLFVESMGPFKTLAVEEQGRIVAIGQVDAADCRLRALFVDARLQRRGVGAALLAELEAHARARGCGRLHGAMSLNAVPFYLRAGFRRCSGAEVLTTAPLSIPVVRMEKHL